MCGLSYHQSWQPCVPAYASGAAAASTSRRSQSSDNVDDLPYLNSVGEVQLRQSARPASRSPMPEGHRPDPLAISLLRLEPAFFRGLPRPGEDAPTAPGSGASSFDVSAVSGSTSPRDPLAIRGQTSRLMRSPTTSDSSFAVGFVPSGSPNVRGPGSASPVRRSPQSSESADRRTLSSPGDRKPADSTSLTTNRFPSQAASARRSSGMQRARN